MGLSYSDLQRQTMTYLLKLMFGESYPEPILANLQKVGLDDEYKQMEKYLKKHVGKKNLDMSSVLKDANLKLNQKVLMAGILTMKQKDIYKSKIIAATALSEPQRTKTISSLITELLTKGMKTVYVGSRVWNIENWLRTEASNALTKMYQDMAFSAGDQVGTTVYRCSQHGGARPKCAPWQNKLIDFSGPTRTETVNGITYQIYNVNETSYGAVDGLRGKNCRHQLIPFILGLNTLADADIPMAENEKIYAAQTKMREYESRLRNLKTQKQYQSDLGKDTSYYDTLIKKAETELNDLTKQTGFKRNYDLERAYG